MRNLRQELNDGKRVIGTWLNSASPIVAEVLAGCGFDFICVDAEHSAIDVSQTQQVFQAITSGNPDCMAAVRLHGVDYSFTKRYLDAGARIVIGPLVNNAEQARLLVEAVKYPPLGRRGVGFCRANAYGQRLQEEFDDANGRILTAVQIEDIAAVEKIDEIVAVEGIDAVFIGPYDLSASMGLTGKFEHPDYVRARDRILKACSENGVHAGIHVIKPIPDELIQRAGEGYKLIAYSLDITMLQTASLEAFERFKSAGILSR